MSEPGKFAPEKKHKVSLADASDLFPTITLYGKLIEDVKMAASANGIDHPFTPGQGHLYAGSVCGYSYAGVCNPVNPAVQVMLPHPDGEADGCGWDPKLGFVEWRNIPKDWVTLHIQTKTGELLDHLTAPAPPPPGSRQIIQAWADLPNKSYVPQDNDQLQALWSQGHPGGGDVGWQNAKAALAATLSRSPYASAQQQRDITSDWIVKYPTVGEVNGYLGW